MQEHKIIIEQLQNGLYKAIDADYELSETGNTEEEAVKKLMETREIYFTTQKETEQYLDVT